MPGLIFWSYQTMSRTSNVVCDFAPQRQRSDECEDIHSSRATKMKPIHRQLKIAAIAALVVLISILHYTTQRSLHHYRVLFRELYFVPIILAGFLFGLRGAAITSLSVTALYTPFVMASWSGFSPEDFNTVIELILFNAIGVMLGMLRDREREKQRRLRASRLIWERLFS
jgi:K+-sensing histidine kinase KdpD